MRKWEAWLFPLHDSFNGVSARIFETFAKWPAGSTPLAFASGWRYFGKRDEGLPVIPTKAFVVAENGLLKTCRVQGREVVEVHAGSKARCVVWSSGLCSLSLSRGHYVGSDWGPRCASRRQDRAQRMPAVKYLLIVSPDVSPDIGHILTICEGQLFSFVLTSAVKMSHPAAVMLWVVFQLVGWIMHSIHIPFLRPHDLHFWDLMPGFEMLPVTVTLTSGRTAWTGSNWHLYVQLQG